MGNLDPNDSRSPYLQVAELLRSQIQDGTYSPGQKLPSYQALADDFGVAVGTIRRAFVLLQDESLLVTRQGQGSFVRTPVDGEEEPEPDMSLSAIYQQLASVQARLTVVEQELNLQD